MNKYWGVKGCDVCNLCTNTSEFMCVCTHIYMREREREGGGEGSRGRGEMELGNKSDETLVSGKAE